MSSTLLQHTGAWLGTNAFRLMPTDPTHTAEARATVALEAGGNVTSIRYTWVHPDDGAQDGLLVLAPGDEPDEVTAFWGDSWHQTPQARLLTGTCSGTGVLVDYDYGGGWRWQIRIETGDAETLRIGMDNVVPSGAGDATLPEGPYPAMEAVLHRLP